jgi:ELWxxDGT repeat protein
VLLASAVPAGDVNTDTAAANLTFLGRSGDTAYFYAFEPLHGWELWRSDGTAAGTRLVKDVQPAVVNLPWVPGLSPVAPWGADVNGTFYFTADDGIHGWELWKTDGTAAGTSLVKDIFPGPQTSTAQFPAVIGDTLYFYAVEPNHFGEIWKTDGTEAGTVPVVQWPFTIVGPFVASGGKFYFTSTDNFPPNKGAEPFVSDGTAAGTHVLKDLVPGAGSSQPRLFTRVGDYVFFVAKDSDSIVAQDALWRTDGTAEGTVRVPLPPDPNTTVVTLYALRPGRAGGKDALYLAYNSYLYRVDATGANATRLGFLNEGQFVAAGDRVLFNGTQNTGPFRELFSTDGTVAGTGLVKDLYPGLLNQGEPSSFFAADDGRAYFAAWDETRATNPPGGVVEKELWTSDGTAGGTYVLNPDLIWDYRFSGGMVPLGGPRVLFAADDGTHGMELWVSDGTPGGTRLVRDVNPRTEDSKPSAGVQAGGLFFFSADDGVHGRELWATDGAVGGAYLVLDIDPRPGPRFYGGVSESQVGSSNPTDFAAMGGVLYFSADDGEHGRELWRSDGTAAGTYMVKDITPTGSDPAQPSLVHYLTPVGNTLFFASGGIVGNAGVYHLWKTDGTDAGTVMLRASGPDGYNDVVGEMAALGNGVVFAAGPSFSVPDRLWVSDGTVAGTRPLGTQVASFADSFVRAGNTLYFFAQTGFAGVRRLWKTDGTDVGTAPVTTVTPPEGEYEPLEMTAVGSRVFFVGFGPGGGGLWVSDGTAGGTRRVADAADAMSGRPEGLVAYHGALFFSATDPAGGRELWRSDGTPAGTYRVADVNPGAGDASPQSMVVAGDWLVFVATDGVHGFEPFRSDGTAGGTSMVVDLWPDVPPNRADWPAPAAMGVLGSRAVVAADDGLHGREPWLIDPAPQPPATVVGRWVFYNGSAFDGGDLLPGTEDDGAVALDKAALLPGQMGSFANVTSYSRGIDGVMIDVAGLPGGRGPTAADFDFGGAAPPATVTVRRRAGVGGSDRVTLAWEEGAVRNGWLRVTVRPTIHTALAAPDAFAVGNLVGETGNGAGPRLGVNVLDFARVRAGRRNGGAAGAARAVGVDNPLDFNRDGGVDGRDEALLRGNHGRSLWVNLPVAAAPTPAPAGPAGASRRGAPVTRGLFGDVAVLS